MKAFVAVYDDVGFFCNSDAKTTGGTVNYVAAAAEIEGCGSDYYQAEGWGDFYNQYSPTWKGSVIIKSPYHYLVD